VGGAYVKGDDLGISLTTEASNTAKVGKYPIVVSWNENPNYTAKLIDGTYTITKTGVKVTASGYNGVYDGKGHSIAVNAEPADEVTVYYGTEALTADNYKTAGDTANPSFEDVGTYTVYYYAKSVGYEPQPVSGKQTISITPAPLTVSAEDQTKVYKDSDPELTYTVDGLIGEDIVTGTPTRETGENAGSYAI
jgi:hypothetical protein